MDESGIGPPYLRQILENLYAHSIFYSSYKAGFRGWHFVYVGLGSRRYFA